MLIHIENLKYIKPNGKKYWNYSNKMTFGNHHLIQLEAQFSH